MTLPTREEARHEWERFDNVDNGYGVSARILAAYGDGVLLTRAEWEATIDSVSIDDVITALLAGGHVEIEGKRLQLVDVDDADNLHFLYEKAMQ